ncbi:MAG: hypothetical protein R3E94_03255 [Burkholderiaceae bacterium]
MSYIIAFVKFSNVNKEYPVACFRKDIKPADNVVVQSIDGRLASATVARLRYLNWDCKSKIICKADEGTLSGGRIHLVPGTPRKIGLVSVDDLIALLRERGWTPLRYATTYRMVLTYNNDVQTGRIWVRKNGVDFQLLPNVQPMPRAFSKLSHSFYEGRFVRHYLSHTTFNLFEGAIRFAQAFERNEGTYDRFFVSVGQSDRSADDNSYPKQLGSVSKFNIRESEDGSDDWQSDWCDGMHAWYKEMMERD